MRSATTSTTAISSSGVSWYYENQSRLTLVDWDADWDNKYRHLLFVEPTGGSGLVSSCPSLPCKQA
jgi:hypothetical protein